MSAPWQPMTPMLAPADLDAADGPAALRASNTSGDANFGRLSRTCADLYDRANIYWHGGSAPVKTADATVTVVSSYVAFNGEVSETALNVAYGDGGLCFVHAQLRVDNPSLTYGATLAKISVGLPDAYPFPAYTAGTFKRADMPMGQCLLLIDRFDVKWYGSTGVVSLTNGDIWFTATYMNNRDSQFRT